MYLKEKNGMWTSFVNFEFVVDEKGLVKREGVKDG